MAQVRSLKGILIRVQDLLLQFCLPHTGSNNAHDRLLPSEIYILRQIKRVEENIACRVLRNVRIRDYNHTARTTIGMADNSGFR